MQGWCKEDAEKVGGEEYRAKQGRVQDEKGRKGREKEEKREKRVQ